MAAVSAGHGRMAKQPKPSGTNLADPADLDGGWEEPASSRVPVSAVRGGTLRFGEDERVDAAKRADDEPKPALPFRLGEALLGRRRDDGSGVQGTTLSWDDLVAAAKQELPKLMATAARDPAAREEIVAIAHALGVDDIGDGDALDALAFDSVLEALDREDDQTSSIRHAARATDSTTPDIVIEGEVDLHAALDGFADDAD